MGLFAITLPPSHTTTDGHSIWFPFVVEAADTVPEFYEAMQAAGGIVLGRRLWVRKEAGKFRIIEWQDHILGREMIGQVSQMNPAKFLNLTDVK